MSSSGHGSTLPRPPSPVRPLDLLMPQPPRSPSPPLSQVDRDQREGLHAIREFLKLRTSYDVLPVSFRLIVLDTNLLVNRSLNILVQNGVVSAPLWNSKTSSFAGLLTSSDYINVIMYYWKYPQRFAEEIERFRLESLREIEQAIGATPIETVSVHPMVPLYDACRRMLSSRARRIPLIDVDDESNQQMVVSVLTQFRILKFVAFNVTETTKLRKPLRELGIVTEKGVVTAGMETPVIKVIEMLVERDISSVPIVDDKGILLNLYESVDILTLIKGGSYEDLNLTVGAALLKRPDDFAGVHTCSLNDSLDAIFHTIRKSRVHRLMVVGPNGELKGVLTLSDILQYILFSEN
ncbi:CBS-domain-containing protein [Ascodesmis nigricans]|uniref:CBS-domain-containing protein n=1 Tax=Ascodesmis nigricans TaxID=341454 RepID=A0A4S2N7K9_9PEZI|nr:CBS-domain-containing protein [Ascodesmis nigricans]